MGVAAARNLAQAVAETVAVVRPGDVRLIEAFSKLGLRVVENPQADEGMGASIGAGVGATPEAGGWLIALADMPWVQPATIRRLADGLRDGASIVAPEYAGRRGHPVGFAAHWRAHLQALHGDRGARTLIATNTDALVVQRTTDAGVVADIDRPQDL